MLWGWLCRQLQSLGTQHTLRPPPLPSLPDTGPRCPRWTRTSGLSVPRPTKRQLPWGGEAGAGPAPSWGAWAACCAARAPPTPLELRGSASPVACQLKSPRGLSPPCSLPGAGSPQSPQVTPVMSPLRGCGVSGAEGAAHGDISRAGTEGAGLLWTEGEITRLGRDLKHKAVAVGL